jgi:hypothetical protein
VKKNFPQVHAIDAKGFSKWFKHHHFWAECCDCGLVHEFQFKAVDGQPAFRVRRANGYTKRQRALRGIKLSKVK